jgi:hypothetical protein
MTRCRILLLGLALLPMAATLSLLAPSSAKAQSQDYIPPQQGDAPRSLRPPQAGDAYYPPQGGGYPPQGGSDNPGYGQPYSAPPPNSSAYAPPPGNVPPPPPPDGAYTSNEILDAGRSFFGGASEGLAKVVEYSFQRNGRPNGYILGEEGSGAVVAGLRYGEGTLYTKGYPPQKVYWQGPSLGYDFGANGSKAFTLVYNLAYPSLIYDRFAGIDGSAYLVGGVGITFQQHGDVILAPIRAGLGLRLGANVGYLKYTPSPTWNPF